MIRVMIMVMTIVMMTMAIYFFTTFKVGLANTVDNALMEFNIDGKGCIAKSM